MCVRDSSAGYKWSGDLAVASFLLPSLSTSGLSDVPGGHSCHWGGGGGGGGAAGGGCGGGGVVVVVVFGSGGGHTFFSTCLGSVAGPRMVSDRRASLEKGIQLWTGVCQHRGAFTRT